jgi:3-methyladenine DNA glycosylase AlkD
MAGISHLKTLIILYFAYYYRIMNREEIIAHLRATANPRAREIWTDFGLETPDEYLGCQITKLREFAKKVKKSHSLALELWDTRIHDAKLLSTMIEEPKKVSEKQIDRQMAEIYSCDLTNRFCNGVVSLTPFSVKKMQDWAVSEKEFYKRAGYCILWEKAKSDASLPDEFFTPYLEIIERELQSERNWIKEMMNYALIGIGSRNKSLNEAATGIALRIGKVKVDYGDTSCKTMEAITSLSSAKLLAKLN